MSITIVQNALLDIFQKNAEINTEFATSLTGTASSSGVNVTGSNTVFNTELAVNDYIGNVAKGYRRVIEITDATHLIVDLAFDSPLDAETIKRIEVKKGLPKNEDLSKEGKVLRVGFIASMDLDEEASRSIGLSIGHSKVWAVYAFLISFGFNEPNEIVADERKGSYDKMIRDIIDNNMTVNGLCLGITEMGKLTIVESPATIGTYFGIMTLTCYIKETRGNR